MGRGESGEGREVRRWGKKDKMEKGKGEDDMDDLHMHAHTAHTHTHTNTTKRRAKTLMKSCYFFPLLLLGANNRLLDRRRGTGWDITIIFLSVVPVPTLRLNILSAIAYFLLPFLPSFVSIHLCLSIG